MKKRSLSIHGHATSLLLEPIFWEQLEHIAQQKGLSLPALIAHIDRQRVRGDKNSNSEKLSSLASCLRVYVVENLRHEGR